MLLLEKKYSLTFSGGVQYKEYKVTEFSSQTTTNGIIIVIRLGRR